MIKEKLKNILFSIIAVVLFFAIIELFLRLFMPFPLTSITTYQEYDDVVYFHKPNSTGYEISPIKEFKSVKLSYDENGFRGHKKNFNKDIVFLVGDSFVESRQVDFKDTISELLNNSIEKNIFVNAGCSGYTDTTEYLLIKNRLLKFKPKKIFLFFSFNDYMDNYTRSGYYTQKDIFINNPDKKFQPTDFKEYNEKLDKALYTRSALYAYYKEMIKPKFKIEVWGSLANGSKFYNSFINVNKKTVQMDPLEKKILTFTHQGLINIKKICDNNNISLSVLIIPLPVQVNSSEWGMGKFCVGYKKDYHELNRVYQDRLISFCKDAGISCYDLLPYFINKSKNKNIFLDYDGHWSEYGQKVISEYLKPFMEN